MEVVETDQNTKDSPGTAAGAGPRARNPRGQGHRLRADLVQAAKELLSDSGDPRELSLRAVAKRAGVAAPSIYRHFPNVDGIKVAVVQDCFADLDHARAAAAEGIADPAKALLARAHAYCHFGLEHPGHYRLMFGPDADLPASLVYESADSPGRAAFESLVAGVRACQSANLANTRTDPVELATATWALEHGLVTLRLSRPHFPWPPLDNILTSSLTQMLGLRSGQ
ncbi:TetR/AcrR family transcriptional regulator [Humibacter ginsengiterrae]